MASSTSQLSTLQRRLTDLNTYQLQRLRDCTGPIGLHSELADELRVDLANVRQGLEVAKEEVELVEGYEDREGAWRVFEGLERDYKRAQVDYRSALLHSKKQISTTKRPLPTTSSSSTKVVATTASNQRSDPQSTVGLSTRNNSNAYPPRSSDFGRGEQDAVQTKTDEVTDALRRTLGTMQVELEKSVMSVQMLEDSTRTLRSTSNLYDTYSSLLTTSSQLVKALERADWWDRLVIALAFLLFLLTVGWVIKRRVLDRVVGGVGWWVGGSARLVKMGLGGGKKAKVVVGQVAGAGKKGAASVIAAGAKTGSALSGVATGASTIATAAASVLGTAKGAIGGVEDAIVDELDQTLADAEVVPPPPATTSAISRPSPNSVKDEL